jgi:hypothetical protein
MLFAARKERTVVDRRLGNTMNLIELESRSICVVCDGRYTSTVYQITTPHLFQSVLKIESQSKEHQRIILLNVISWDVHTSDFFCPVHALPCAV